MSSSSPIVVDGLWKRYDLGRRGRLLASLAAACGVELPLAKSEFWALSDVSFEVRPEEALGILGHNGAGKSTLLKILSGITRPTRGTFAVRGRVAPLIEVGAGFHQELSGRENIDLNAAILGLSRAEIVEKMDAIIEFAELEPFIDVPVKRYSSGMIARLGFTVSLFSEPEVLLVDEVLSVGDLSFVLKSYRKVDELRRSGIPVVLVSHNLQLIRNFCNRAIWLDHGELRAEGDPREVCALYTRAVLDEEGEGPSDDAGQRRQADPTLSIERVRFLRGDGSESTSFATGEPFAVELTIASARPTGPLSFEISAWQDESNALLFRHDSARDQVAHPGLSAAGSQRVVMRLERLPFVTGRHTLSVSVCEGGEPKDIHERRYHLRIAGGSVGYGSFHAFPEWHYPPGRETVRDAGAQECSHEGGQESAQESVS
jgi:lipopolysaccharide transport system ATP-binding protein